jgi:hypothetical protein
MLRFLTFANAVSSQLPADASLDELLGMALPPPALGPCDDDADFDQDLQYNARDLCSAESLQLKVGPMP